MKKILLLTAVCYVQCALFNAFAQDIHFSQFYNAPLVMNPALTGAFSGDQRAIINYKDQWRTVGSPYQTALVSFDMGIMKKKWKSAYLGTGITVYSDKAGDTQLGTTQVNLSASGIVYIGESQFMSAGLQGGFAQRSIKTEKMQWGNQFDGNAYNPAMSSGETNPMQPYSFGDFSMGLTWNYGTGESSLFANNEFKANLGVALFHVNKPEQQFNTFQQVDRMYSKIGAHGGVSIGIGNTNLTAQPSFFYWKQGPQQQLNVGAFLRYQLKAESQYTGVFKETALSLGGYMRTKDAFIPSIFFEYGHYALGITYDVNVSDLKTVSNKKGGVEISLRFINPNPFRGGETKSVRFL